MGELVPTSKSRKCEFLGHQITYKGIITTMFYLEKIAAFAGEK